MDVIIEREACCAADDQIGPLETHFDIGEETTLGELAYRLVHARFLQFTSSHTIIHGTSAGRDLLRIGCPVHADGRTVFLVDPDLPAAKVIANGRIRFDFRQR